MSATHTICAFAVIFDEASKVLLGHRRDEDVWNLPGGKLEAHETPWDAVVREVREETGLQVRVERLLGVRWQPGCLPEGASLMQSQRRARCEQ